MLVVIKDNRETDTRIIQQGGQGIISSKNGWKKQSSTFRELNSLRTYPQNHKRKDLASLNEVFPFIHKQALV